MPIRIIIGGPPNSGKSTLAESLARALRSFGVDAYAEDLDLASPTLEFIKGAKGWEQRVGAKKEWAIPLAEQAASRFEAASFHHALVIGDAPGKITEVTQIIAKKADYALILCRYDRKSETANWQEFFERLNVPVLCVAISKLTGKGSFVKKGVIRATVIGLNRKPKTDELISGLALLIKDELGL